MATYLNGGLVAERNSANSAFNVSSSPLDIGYYSVGSEYFSGKVAELFVYNTALSTNAQALVNQYQSAKWGIALTGPGVIGTETGLTGTEAQQAMASVQAGATTDGYSVFSANYLNRLSQSSNIILQASNNVNIDLQGATLTLAAGKNITLTAGNQILTDSTGTITTSQSSGSGGNITFNATNGIIFNNAFSLSSGGGAINLNNPVTLNAALTVASAGGNVDFTSTINGANGLSVNSGAGTTTFGGNVGGNTSLGTISVTGPAALDGNVATNNVNITFNNAVTLDANSTVSAGSGEVDFASTVNGDFNLTASAGTFSFGGALGGTTPLAAVSLTSANTLALPSISAASLVAQTTGATADLSIASGATLTASGAGTAVTLAAGRNFANNSGSGAIDMTGGGRWLIYSATPGGDTFDSLNSGNTAVWDATYGGTVAQTGDRYVFSYEPTVTLTSTSDSKSYGTDATSAVAADYSISGLEAAVANAFLGDTNATAFSGDPSVTSSGSAASAQVSGGPYAINVAQGTLAGVDGHALAYSSAGQLTVNPAPLTITANSQTKIYGRGFAFTGTEFTTSGLQDGETVGSADLSSNGAPASMAAGSYAINASDASGGTFNLANYSITYQPGTLTVAPVPATQAGTLTVAVPATLALGQILAPQPFGSDSNAFSPLPTIVTGSAIFQTAWEEDAGQTDNTEPALTPWDDSPWADTVIPSFDYLPQNHTIIHSKNNSDRLLPQ